MMTKQSDYISIEHVGVSDKPIQTIIISKEAIEKPNSVNYLVSNKVYNNVKNIIELNKANNDECDKNEYGSFNLCNFERDTINLNYNLGRKKSIQLFDQIIETLKREENNQKLISEFQTIKRRISF